MIRANSVKLFLVAVVTASSSGCLAINPDVNGDGAVTMEDFDALFAGCGSDDGAGGGTDDGAGTPGTDDGTSGDELPDDGSTDSSSVP
jgi:hypothetical protein